MTPVVGKVGQGESGARLGPGDADGLALGEGDGLSRGWQSSVDRRTSEMLPSIWANLMTSASCDVTARITICCWPLRVVSAPAPGDACALPLLSRCGGGSSVPSTWTPWMSVLTVVGL